ncbi:MAG: pilin [Patescibacteria group bacterium]|jgi:amino acid transporter
MKKILLKKAVVLAMSLLILTPVLAFSLPAFATDTLNPWGSDSLKDNIQTETGLGERDPRDIAASVINVILGFLGIVAVIIILLGGFKWMTAGGNEDKVGEAKKLITAGIIGLVIIVASFAIATFVLDSLINATTD